MVHQQRSQILCHSFHRSEIHSSVFKSRLAFWLALDNRVTFNILSGNSLHQIHAFIIFFKNVFLPCYHRQLLHSLFC